MAFITKEKVFTKEWFKAYSFILVGTFIMAVGFVFFIAPYKFAPGGVYGIAIVVHHLTIGMFDFLPNGFPIGLTALIMDIPLAILGTKILGPRFGVKTVVGFVSTAAFVDILQHFNGNNPFVENEPLLSAIFGGLLIGLGLGLIFRSRATSGGTDIVAMILAKYTKLPLGQLMIYVDSAVVLITFIAFKDWSIPLYSLIVIFVTGKVIDIVIQGVDYKKAVFIISEKHEEIRAKILTDLDRGGTYLKGKGLFRGNEKQLIYSVLSRREVEVLKDFIKKIDPDAFLTVINAKEILGHGFKSFKDDV